MSTLKVSALQGLSASSDAITLANDGTCTANITNNLSNRNKIINGAMTVSQRNGTSAVQLSASEQYFIDRWENDSGSSFDMKCDASQSSEAPEGFANSMKFDCDGVSAVSGSHNGLITTFLEGQDLQDLKFGTSNAEDITLSFYAKSGSQNNGHVYGVFLGAYLNGTRNAQTKGFTVTSSWQRFTMTFAGTGTVTSTGINNNNSKGMQVAFSLAVGPDDDENYSTWTANSGLLGFTGQDNFFDNTSNELYITGVQLEVGSVATDFEHRSYGQELALCKRYYQQFPQSPADAYGPIGSGRIRNSTNAHIIVFFPEMRSSPTCTKVGDLRILHAATSTAVNSVASSHMARNIVFVEGIVSSGLTQGEGCMMTANNDSSGKITLSAEL